MSPSERDGGAVERSETAPDVARARRKARRDGQSRDRRSTAWSSRAPANESEPEARSGGAAPTRYRARRPPGGGGWRAIIRDLRDRDRAALDRLAGMAMAHASEAFYSLDDPLEATDDPTLVKIV